MSQIPTQNRPDFWSTRDAKTKGAMATMVTIAPENPGFLTARNPVQDPVQDPFSTLNPAFLAAEEMRRLLVTDLSNSTAATWLSGHTWADFTPLTFRSAASALAAEVAQVTPSSLNWAFVTFAAALVAQQAEPFSHFSESPAKLGRARAVEAARIRADRYFMGTVGFVSVDAPALVDERISRSGRLRSKPCPRKIWSALGPGPCAS